MKLTTNDGLQLGDGSFGTPSISFTGDTDTGIYRVNTNQLGIATGGTISIIFAQNFTPVATADTSGVTNQFSFDANYIYIKTSAGWKRAALSTWIIPPP